MASEDRHCAFCGEKIVWNESFTMESGKEYHIAPRHCWGEYLETKEHKERDRFEYRNGTDSE